MNYTFSYFGEYNPGILETDTGGRVLAVWRPGGIPPSSLWVRTPGLGTEPQALLSCQQVTLTRIIIIIIIIIILRISAIKSNHVKCYSFEASPVTLIRDFQIVNFSCEGRDLQRKVTQLGCLV